MGKRIVVILSFPIWGFVVSMATCILFIWFGSVELYKYVRFGGQG